MKNKPMIFLLKLISLIFILMLPFFVVFLITELKDNQYEETFLGEFEDKYRALNEKNEKKMIFVGGSSLPFGLRSDLIEQQFPDYKVVNFGLYATLGTKFMMDMSKSNINEGDIVILSLELNQQTYSLYFNPEAVLQACDGFAFKYKYLSFSDNLQLFYNYYKFAFKKLEYCINHTTPNPIGIYRHDSFNEFGDIQVERPNNIMNNGVDSTMKITLDNLLNQEFIDYVNEYCAFVRNKNAKIYFNFSPCNELAVYSSKKTRDEFQNKLDLSIKCDLLSNLDNCIIDYRYFYDTNFHLNSSGAIYYTALLIDNLKMKLGMEVIKNEQDDEKNDNSQGEIVIPTPPKVDDDVVVVPPTAEDKVNFDKYNGEPNNDYLDYFNYRLMGSSYQIIGIKEEYKDIEKIILPSTYNGKNITTIVADALYGCINLKEIYIGPTYRVFEENSFDGCISLEKIYFFQMDGNKLSPASSGLLNGTSRNIKIYIPEGSNYLSGYTWMNYSDYFVFFSRGEES